MIKRVAWLWLILVFALTSCGYEKDTPTNFDANTDSELSSTQETDDNIYEGYDDKKEGNINDAEVDTPEEPSEFVPPNHSLMGWPSSANSSWDRFYSYGGTFYIDQWNTWICNVGGSAIAWEDNRWTYWSSQGDYFLQYDGSDYFHIDPSDPFYAFNMHSLTGWVQLTPFGMVSCKEPQIFRDGVEALKQAVYDINFENKVAAFEALGFRCFEENGVWKCDTQSGILTFDEDSRTWYGTVDIYNAADGTWEYNVDIMVDTNLKADHLFRYVDGRYDEGVGVDDPQTSYSTGFTYNISNYGIPGSEYYQNNSINTITGHSYVDDFTGIPGFIGFYIYEYNYPVRIYDVNFNPDISTITVPLNTSATIIMYQEFKSQFSLTCEYNDTIITTAWGPWQTNYATPRIELTISAVSPGVSTLKIYSEKYPHMAHIIEVIVE